jgi:dTDP-4-amino-4,6-dideoxygalactose transaminase
MELPISRPHLPDRAEYARHLEEMFRTGQVTNGQTVRDLESELSRRLSGVHVVAVSSGTMGLVLTLRATTRPGDQALLPSFTFPATLQAVLWSGLEPRLVDCVPETYTVSAETLSRALTPDSRVFLPVYVFGASPPWDELGPLIEERNLVVVSDAAHALGSTWQGRPVGGMGTAEVFSMAPTKLLVAAEGGLVATRSAALADRLRRARNHGNAGDYECDGGGFNGRLSELHALLALKGLSDLDQQIRRRQHIQGLYAEALREIPGVGLQRLHPMATSTWNYMGVRFDPEAFGAEPAEIQEWLAKRGIESRRYFSPPLHRQRAFAHLWDAGAGEFPGTDRLVRRILCLPMWSDMPDSAVGEVAQALRELHTRRGPQRAAGAEA